MPRKRRDDLKNLTVRVEPDLLERIRQAAEKDDRSINGYVVASMRRQLQQLMPEQMRKRERGK